MISRPVADSVVASADRFNVAWNEMLPGLVGRQPDDQAMAGRRGSEDLAHIMHSTRRILRSNDAGVQIQFAPGIGRIWSVAEIQPEIAHRLVVLSASACAYAGCPSMSNRRISGRAFGASGSLRSRFSAGQDGVLIELDVFLSDGSKNHRKRAGRCLPAEPASTRRQAADTRA
jgi:hypothetical protein